MLAADGDREESEESRRRGEQKWEKRAGEGLEGKGAARGWTLGGECQRDCAVALRLARPASATTNFPRLVPCSGTNTHRWGCSSWQCSRSPQHPSHLTWTDGEGSLPGQAETSHHERETDQEKEPKAPENGQKVWESHSDPAPDSTITKRGCLVYRLVLKILTRQSRSCELGSIPRTTCLF